MKKTKGTFGAGMRWSTRMLSMGMVIGVIGYFNLYGSSVLGLDTGVLGVLSVICSIIDVITNFIVANYIDSHHPKLGKGRPYELFLIPAWIAVVLMFAIPSGLSAIVKYVLYFLLSVLYGPVFVTFLNCAESVYFAHAYKDEDRRIGVQSVYAIMTIIAYLIPGLLLPVLLGHFQTVEHGWTIMMVLVGVPFLAIGLIRFLTVKEENEGEDEPQVARVTLRESIKALFTNKYVVLVAIANLTYQIGNGMANMINTYYFTYVMGRVELLSAVSVLSAVCVVFIPMYTKMMRKMGKGPVLKYAMVISAIGYVARFFAYQNFELIVFGSFLVALGYVPMAMMSNLMILDCMDFGQWKNGKRLESAIFAGVSVGATIGPNLGVAVAGIALSIAGFAGTALVQTPMALDGIRLAFSIIPAIITAVTVFVLQFYDLDKRLPAIKKELMDREHK